MWNKIIKFFKKITREKEYVSAIKFKESIKALGIERYKGITIVYLAKPKPIYHFWYKQSQELFFDEADTYEELTQMAHDRIDELK